MEGLEALQSNSWFWLAIWPWRLNSLNLSSHSLNGFHNNNYRVWLWGLNKFRVAAGTQEILFFFQDFIYLFLREGEKKGEKHQCVVTSHTPHNGDLACNPGMCPTGNGTSSLLVHRPAHKPLSHTSQGLIHNISGTVNVYLNMSNSLLLIYIFIE